MKYYLTYKVDTEFQCEVEADSLNDAIKKGEDLFEDANIGDLELVDMDFVSAEDENGNYI